MSEKQRFIPILNLFVRELEALNILGIDPADIRCAYCGDKSTEWDHLRPIITNQEPTGYITEIANLVPSCGKCNQSKGNKNWLTWMKSSAQWCPTTRKVADLEKRIERLKAYEAWKDIQAKEKDGLLTEDDKFRLKDELQEKVDKANDDLETEPRLLFYRGATPKMVRSRSTRPSCDRGRSPCSGKKNEAPSR